MILSGKPHKPKSQFHGLLGRRIAAIREESGKTQQELSKITGVCRSHLAEIEAGKFDPKIGTLQKIAEGLGHNLTDLFKPEWPSNVG
jgi:transcriptional regulator with XRE-family HTH domain